MSYKKFSRSVKNLLENNGSVPLHILLEKEEEDLSDMFDDPSLEDEGDDSKGEEETEKSDDESNEESSKETESSETPAEESDANPSQDQLDTELQGTKVALEKIQNFYSKFGQSEDSEPLGLQKISDYVNSYVSSAELKDSDTEPPIKIQGESKRKYSLNNKNSIKHFLNEKVDAEEVANDIEAVNNIIDKGSELIDQFKKGKELNIPRYVEASINAYRNFDSLFSKESIIKQATINLIVLNSGAKAEENITEFEELFHEELHKQFGIEYEEHALITKPFHTSTGAMKQS
jgi:hypothetical protein